MLPSQATTPDELLKALTDNASDEMPLVNVKVLIDSMGVEMASKLVVIRTHEFVSRTRAIELIVMHRALQLLSPDQQASIFPQRTENLGNENIPQEVRST